MEPIYYDEAAELLGITLDTLRHGITRKVLTRLPRRGQRQQLIKEQVLLFKGKRLSLAALTPQERKKRDEYEQMASATGTPAHMQAITRQDVNSIKTEVATEVKDDVIKGLIDSLSGMLSRPKASAPA